MLKSFCAFMVAVFQTWWVIVMTIIDAVIGLVARFGVGISVPAWLWPLLLGLPAFIGAFWAFHKLHKKLIQRDWRDKVYVLIKACEQCDASYLHVANRDVPMSPL